MISCSPTTRPSGPSARTNRRNEPRLSRIIHLCILWGLGLFAVHSLGCGDAQQDIGASTGGPTGAGTSSNGAETNSTGQNGTTTSSTGTSGTPTTGPEETSTTSTGDSTSGSTAMIHSTGDTTSDSTTSTTESGECSLVHQGNLIVKKDTDLAPLAEIGRITGDLYIIMYGRDQPDLSFLSCLHTIDGGVSIQNNDLLESTKGLENLKSVLRIEFYYNPSLHAIYSMGPIVDLFSLTIDGNPSLEEIHFDSLETVGLLQIGHCSQMSAAANHKKLLSLSGFAALTNVQDLVIEGNEALQAADVLSVLISNGAPNSLSTAEIRYNLLLPEGDVNAELDVLGLDMQHRNVCGNAGGNPECFCVVG